MKNLSNIVGFQVAWWACMLGAANGLPYIGPVVMAVYLIAHYYWISVDRNEVKLIIIFTVFGTFVDSLLILSGSITCMGYYVPGLVIAPLWITAMWSGFTSTVNHSMAWLKDRWVLAFFLGIIFGPLSYMTGLKFGAIQFNTSLLNLLIILAIIWGISIPFIYHVNRRLRVGT